MHGYASEGLRCPHISVQSTFPEYSELFEWSSHEAAVVVLGNEFQVALP